MAILEIEEEVCSSQALPLLSLNHVSLVVKSVWASVRFYVNVLGFVLVKRPSSFDFHGAWLYNYGIGIHLIERDAMDCEYQTSIEPRRIDPKDNHISFQCTDVELVRRRLEDKGMKYVSAVVEDEGIKVDQVFFHDPDGYMIEVCNCENLPVLPISSPCPFKPNFSSVKYDKMGGITNSCALVLETIMMESLTTEMMNFSF
ncbi:unnamed protein product [Coffea canephora]|uniref:VOC domain-containing protein n=1 Tax=Coffea canephora TaxID=49390 RepID=A0A068U084_COFCA|nr:unnamed protein product [Coffea canephora]